MNLIVLTVVASMNADTGYVGVYRDMDQCKEMQGIYITHLDPSAIMVCDIATRLQPVLIPPPRPADLRSARQSVLIPPPRP